MSDVPVVNFTDNAINEFNTHLIRYPLLPRVRCAEQSQSSTCFVMAFPLAPYGRPVTSLIPSAASARPTMHLCRATFSSSTHRRRNRRAGEPGPPDFFV